MGVIGVGQILVKLGHTPGADDVATWRSMGSNDSLYIDDLDLHDGDAVYACAVAVNGAWS